jgi:hypothetical protein
MERELNEYHDTEVEAPLQFLSEQIHKELEIADANPFIRISTPDKSIPFIILSDGGVVADIRANNPKTIAGNMLSKFPTDNLQLGAGFIDVHFGNKTLVFRHVESGIFGKKWLVDDVASALQTELNLYYPDFKIRSR